MERLTSLTPVRLVWGRQRRARPSAPARVSHRTTSFLLTPFLPAQDTDKDMDDAIQEATESGKKMGENARGEEKFEEVDKEEAKEKAALQKQLEATGPVGLPDWTPKYRSSNQLAQFRRKL